VRIAHLDREEFLNRKLDIQPGEHGGFWEPTQGGKTHLAYQCAAVAMKRNPHLRFVSAMPKSRSPATRMWADRLDLKIIDQWPPPHSFSRPRGYVFWPKHLRDAPADQNRAHLAGQFRRMLHDQYQEGDSFTLADDVYVLACIYGLNTECEEFWTAGAEGNAGLWAPNQKPSGTIGGGSVSSFSYNSPTHLFFGRDTDERNQKRFSEIGGGVDPKLVASIVPHLKTYRIQTPAGRKSISEKLYIDKRGPYMALVGPLCMYNGFMTTDSNEKRRAYYASPAGREAIQRANARWREKNRTPDDLRERYATDEEYRDGVLRRQRDYEHRKDDEARKLVFDHYGRVCSCCGSMKSPTIDHIEGDGAAHRRELKIRGGAKMYRWLVKNCFPPGYQTLCKPCNNSKASGAACKLQHIRP
jgi:hypothetical protein